MGVALDPAAAGRMVALLDLMAVEPQNLTSIEGMVEGVERHLADSLSALALPGVAGAASIVDIGSGAGFPGIPLAMARPHTAVTLVESERRKGEWLRRASGGCPNVRVVSARTEELASDEREAWSLATARAVGPLPVVLELAAPLVAVGGSVVVWRGDHGAEEEDRAARAAAELGLEPLPAVPVTPFPGARRHLLPFAKREATPSRYPRRPGRAAKRPLA